MYFTVAALGAGEAAIYFLKSKKKVGTSKFGNNLGDMECKYGDKIGYTIAKDVVIKPKKMLEHILYVGASGEAKTAAGVINNLLKNKIPPCSKVIADLKGEIYDLTHEYRESLGEKCIIFEPLGEQARINPLDFCEEVADIKDIAMNMLMNTFKADYDKWCDMALPLLTAALMWAKTLPKDFAHIPRAVQLLTKNPVPKIVERLEGTKDELILEQVNMFKSCADSKPTEASILVTLLSKLNIFTDPKIARNLEKSDFTPMDLRRHLINIYVKYDLAKVDYLKPILALFMGQMLDKLMSKYKDNDNQNTVLFIFDEMQNNGKIPKLPSGITMYRYYKIGLVGLIQNFSQMYHIYGQYEAQTIISGFKTKCVLPALSDEIALKYLSSTFISGNTQIIINNGKTNSTVKKPLFDGDELRRLPDGKIAIIAGNKDVIIADQDRWYLNKECVKNRSVM